MCSNRPPAKIDSPERHLEQCNTIQLHLYLEREDVFTVRSTVDKEDEYGDALIEENTPRHNYRTRNAILIRIPPTRLTKTKRIYSNKYLKICQNHKEAVDKIQNQDTLRRKEKRNATTFEVRGSPVND